MPTAPDPHAAAAGLSDVNVVIFGAYAAGPAVGKYLANAGARVVHVESRQRPDGFRTQYPPYKGGVPGINRSGCFGLFNDSKLGITLNLKAPGSLELAYRLVRWADVVIENWVPGTAARLGLDYPRLAAENPRLVMLSTCTMGQTGPRAQQPGFGSQLTAFSGFSHITGLPDGPPGLLYGPYIDFIAVAYGAVAILAALEQRRQTGRGQHIDIAQYETGLQFMAPALLEYTANGRSPGRQGNRSPHSAPHGAYPCADGQWLALSCWSDDEWQRLALLAGRGWEQDARFATLAARKEHEDALDAAVAEWTGTRPAATLQDELQAAGLSAGLVQTMRDLFTDPQLAHRSVWRGLPHAEMERQQYRAPSYLLSDVPVTMGPAPLLGEHNDHVYRELLGLTEAEYDAYVRNGVID